MNRVMKELSAEEWNKKAHDAKVLPASAALRKFQIECSNLIISSSTDICVIAPTGFGKSLLWCLPLLPDRAAVSLVITPYTSLGAQGEAEYVIILLVPVVPY